MQRGTGQSAGVGLGGRHKADGLAARRGARIDQEPSGEEGLGGADLAAKPGEELVKIKIISTKQRLQASAL